MFSRDYLGLLMGLSQDHMFEILWGSIGVLLMFPGQFSRRFVRPGLSCGIQWICVVVILAGDVLTSFTFRFITSLL